MFSVSPIKPNSLKNKNQIVNSLHDAMSGCFRPNFTKMKGKYSIKQIIKSIPTNISYTEEGNIDGGRRAQLAWYRCTDPNVTNEEKENEKTLLKQYCAKDTFAMYDLVKYWLQK
jgi:uncharacterized protein (UPF0128 family)